MEVEDISFKDSVTFCCSANMQGVFGGADPNCVQHSTTSGAMHGANDCSLKTAWDVPGGHGPTMDMKLQNCQANVL